MDASYGIPHGMGVNHFFSPAAPRAEQTWGDVDLSRCSKPEKAFVLQCPQCQQEAVDVASGARGEIGLQVAAYVDSTQSDKPHGQVEGRR